MKKIIIILFLLVFAVMSILLYLKINSPTSLEESLLNSRNTLARKGGLDFFIQERLLREGKPVLRKPSLQIKLSGPGRRSSYLIEGQARFQTKRALFVKRNKRGLLVKPRSASPLLPTWLKAWNTDSRLLTARLTFSPAALKAEGKEKTLLGQEVFFYPISKGDDFLKNIIPPSEALFFKQGGIAFSRESSLPLYLHALWRGPGIENSGLRGVEREITIKIDWDGPWKN